LLDLTLYSNQLSGSIPNFNFPNLTSLGLQSNQLSGDIPNFNLPNLISLQLQSNQLSGSIPNFNFLNLLYLSLAENQLSGSIPNFNFPNLINLFLYSNQLNGNIPNFSLPNLQHLWLYSNQLSGSIPNFNLPNLQTLYLSSNQLSGSIPNFNLPNLHGLYLNNNQLTGSIPAFNFPNLQSLYLHLNQLSGSIPNFNLPNLNTFHFYSNQIDSVRNLSALPLRADTAYWRGLRAQNNKLTFDDILPNMGFASSATFIYTPQDSIYSGITHIFNVGQTFTIDLGIDATITTNVYKWFKNGVLYQTITGSNKLIFNSLQASDAGTYTCEVTNPNAPALTLYSRKAILYNNCLPVVTEQSYNLVQGGSITIRGRVYT
jgi:hypothetical protein